MVKVFTLNKNGKIELTKDELEKILNEAYWEGYRANSTWTYTSPNYLGQYYYTTCSSSNATTTSTAPSSGATLTTASNMPAEGITIKIVES